ncbi:SRPBCC family protein [Teichococcus oryzae]|uniref:Carbon monoxide dehydrogenase subunit G n=1 Tax=Teichococcus oryzae TaxID=1608942 RepID=A0A5B2TMN6_9PROT|nr:carbon monoxide dehydrogenase subunit G [Pseudoroseomonas oryzae]KAA2214970.1 carbon monoxide dehydrogenase subunit G [Pseudoroseomonas oryzae]
MEMTGERTIAASRQVVWEGLNDPEVLRASIPGCESIEKTGDDSMQARVAIKIGPMAARFNGKVKLENLNPPASYTISGEGNGGAMGFAKGGADVSLEELGPQSTLLKYAVKAQVGGKMAQLGARLIDSTAKQMADQFFNRFAATVAPEAAPEATAEAPRGPAGEPAAPRPSGPDLPEGTAPTPAPGTEIGDTSTTERLGAATLIGAGLAEHAGETPPGGRPAPVTTPGAPTRHRPAPPPPQPISIFALMPDEIMGFPIVFWIGSAVWLVILFLLFVLG